MSKEIIPIHLISEASKGSVPSVSILQGFLSIVSTVLLLIIIKAFFSGVWAIKKKRMSEGFFKIGYSFLLIIIPVSLYVIVFKGASL